MSGPSENIPLSAELMAAAGQYQAALKAANSELNQLRKQQQEHIKNNNEINRELQEQIKKAAATRDSIKQMAVQQQKIQKHQEYLDRMNERRGVAGFGGRARDAKELWNSSRGVYELMNGEITPASLKDSAEFGEHLSKMLGFKKAESFFQKASNFMPYVAMGKRAFDLTQETMKWLVDYEKIDRLGKDSAKADEISKKLLGSDKNRQDLVQAFAKTGFFKGNTAEKAGLVLSRQQLFNEAFAQMAGNQDLAKTLFRMQGVDLTNFKDDLLATIQNQADLGGFKGDQIEAGLLAIIKQIAEDMKAIQEREKQQRELEQRLENNPVLRTQVRDNQRLLAAQMQDKLSKSVVWSS